MPSNHPHDGAYRVGPLTDAVVFPPERPSPAELEWFRLLKTEGEYVLYWAGAYRGHGDPNTYLGWGSFRSPLEPGQPALTDPELAPRMERLLSPLAHASRLRLLQVLAPGPQTSAQLSAATGLRGGNLYYHLKELIYGGYVEETPAGYQVSATGRKLLITLVCLATAFVEDGAGAEDLFTPTDLS